MIFSYDQLSFFEWESILNIVQDRIRRRYITRVSDVFCAWHFMRWENHGDLPKVAGNFTSFNLIADLIATGSALKFAYYCSGAAVVIKMFQCLRLGRRFEEAYLRSGWDLCLADWFTSLV